MTSGSRIAAMTILDTSGVTALPRAEAPAAARVLLDRRPEALLVEVRPERVVEDELGVRGLPEQEVRDPLLARRADDEIGIAQVGRVQAGRDVRFRQVLVSDTFPENRAHCFHELGAAAVVERNPELQAVEMLRGRLQSCHLLPQLGRDAVAAAEEARTYALPREVGELAIDGLVHPLHDRLDLVCRPCPVLGRERVHREGLDPQIDGRLHGSPESSRTLAMAVGDGQATCRRPAPVPVHDDRDASRCRSRLVRQRQTSMISASFTFKRSSIDFVCSSVIFWTCCSARRSSSSPTSPLTTRSFRCCMMSRRTFRIATLPSSATRRTTLTRSLRRSSVSAGIGSRISLPSFDGVNPRADSWIARSIVLIEPGSNGWIVSSRGSGALIVASCLSGVCVP